MNNDILRNLEPVFYPKSIAVVGASSDESKSGTQFLRALLAAGYRGSVYPVNRSGGTSCGLHVYPDLRSIPGPVDYVIVAIPRDAVLKLMEDCGAKGVKAVQLFTAGFRESGTETGMKLEKEIADVARRSGFRLIGPNCIGVYNPSIRMPYGPMSTVGDPGCLGFISQSGGHGGRFVELGLERDINFSKLISFGNGADLDCVDFLEYLAVDPQTEMIGAYLESISRPARFLEVVRQVSAVKPVVIWKGGRTAVGGEAAASHTGALSSSYAVWQGAMRQAGVIPANNLEELADTIVALQHIGPHGGRRIACVTGLGGGGGGESVLAADTFVDHNLEVPRLSETARRSIEALLPPAGTILRNPLDLGGVLPEPQALAKIVQMIFAAENVDTVILQEHFGRLLRSLPQERVLKLNEALIEVRQAQHKPLVVVAPSWAPTPAAVEIEKALRAAGVPVYRSFEAAARSLAKIAGYYERRQKAGLADPS